MHLDPWVRSSRSADGPLALCRRRPSVALVLVQCRVRFVNDVTGGADGTRDREKEK